MPISRFNSKKKEIGQNNHLLSFVVTCCHSLSLVVPLVVTRSTTRCHSLLLVVCIFINDQKSRHFITWMYFDYERIKRSIFLLCKQTKVQVMMKSVSMLLRIVSDRGRNFPRRLKDSQSYAVFKVGDENNFGSYWPISALSCFSWENHVWKTFQSFIRAQFTLSPTVWFSARSLNGTCHNVTYISK